MSCSDCTSQTLGTSCWLFAAPLLLYILYYKSLHTGNELFIKWSIYWQNHTLLQYQRTCVPQWETDLSLFLVYLLAWPMCARMWKIVLNGNKIRPSKNRALCLPFRFLQVLSWVSSCPQLHSLFFLLGVYKYKTLGSRLLCFLIRLRHTSNF